MILINQVHLDKFKVFSGSYNYPVSNGVWLTFNKDTLIYEGCYCFFEKRNITRVNEEVELAIKKLLARDIIYLKD